MLHLLKILPKTISIRNSCLLYYLFVNVTVWVKANVACYTVLSDNESVNSKWQVTAVPAPVKVGTCRAIIFPYFETEVPTTMSDINAAGKVP